ncbi:aspartate aminotransferase family protein [Paraburkholderia guartelaensis]|uniref:Aspartate aminotransferase family protein n=1 Tax=Paraburkholderia guartelaensis TaxID=2546446 RepID=A0A4R5L6W4_9BURK|nr:aspartate aminotransferase family protein [Paraburkholderia guartelaensis]TDG03555.1 aspartate aminotransferase family protein [Paraburkholderia guartelaensis]
MKQDKAMLNSFDPSATNALTAAEKGLVNRRAAALGTAYRLFYEQPLHIVRGEGVWLFDTAANAYLDAYNNVASVGHCHPKVVEAIASQAAVLNTHTRYLHDGILTYAEKLLATFPGALSNVMFTCTGSEANDLALRIARFRTGGSGIIVTQLAYHGVTSAVAAVSSSLGESVPLGTDVRTVPAPDTYLGDPATVGERFAQGVKAAIADLKRHGIKPAALLVDTIFSSDGVFADPAGFLGPAVEAIRAEGGLFIADEVQAGFARTGSKMWGFQRHGIVPDIVTMGKPMGNGHPIAGLVVRPEVVSEFGASGRYFNTFGGNPVSCAAAMATLRVIQEEGLQENSRAVGAYIREGIRELAVRHELIGDVRGDGLFIGVELVSDQASKTAAKKETNEVVNEMRRRRVLISATGTRGNVLKIRPLLPFSRENADQLVETLDAALTAVSQRRTKQ